MLKSLTSPDAACKAFGSLFVLYGSVSLVSAFSVVVRKSRSSTSSSSSTSTSGTAAARGGEQRHHHHHEGQNIQDDHRNCGDHHHHHHCPLYSTMVEAENHHHCLLLGLIGTFSLPVGLKLLSAESPRETKQMLLSLSSHIFGLQAVVRLLPMFDAVTMRVMEHTVGSGKLPLFEAVVFGLLGYGAHRVASMC